MRILLIHSFSWDTLPAKLKEINRIAGLAKVPDPIRFETLKLNYPEVEVKDGRVTHAYFDKHISDYARQNGYQGVFLCLSRYQAKRLDLESGLRGAYQNDDDAMMEGWIVADEDDKVEIEDEETGEMIDISQFIKTTLHELGHGLCDWYGVPDTVHSFDFKRDHIDIEEFYRTFKPNSGVGYALRSIMESLGVIRARVHRSLPIPYWNWTQVTQSYLNADRRLYPRSGVHVGTDFRGKAGDPVFAPIDGPVTRAGYSESLGYWLEFKMGSEYMVALHLKELPRKGRHYKRGEVIGIVGDTGMIEGEHYHLEGWWKPMDRSKLTSEEAVRLHTFDIVKHIG